MKTPNQWKDVYKAILGDTDVILEVLDARNPQGTHNHAIEEFIAKEKPAIQILLILNKCDVLPTEVLKAWLKWFEAQKYFVVAVSAKYHRGVEELFQQLRILATDAPKNVLIVGYPNTGKSTLIEALTKNTKKVGVSSEAGFTRGIRRIKLTQRVFLIDTPGVIPIDETDETELAIKACMIADKLEDPLAVVEAIFKLLPQQQFEQMYNISLDPTDGPDELIQKLGIKSGRLKHGGLVNESEVQKMLIRDWQSNRLRYYVIPPNFDSNKG